MPGSPTARTVPPSAAALPPHQRLSVAGVVPDAYEKVLRLER